MKSADLQAQLDERDEVIGAMAGMAINVIPHWAIPHWNEGEGWLGICGDCEELGPFPTPHEAAIGRCAQKCAN